MPQITPKSAIKEYRHWKNLGWFKYSGKVGDRNVYVAVTKPIEELFKAYPNVTDWKFNSFSFLL